MKKFQRLFCDTCNRSTDKQIDNVRFVSDKCTITLNCEGRLSPLENISKPEIATAPALGLQDWRPRNVSASTETRTQEPVFFDISTGSRNQLTIAIPFSGDIPSSVALEFLIKPDAPKEFRKYIFRFDTAFSTIVGVESGSEKNTLRYSQDELVEVFVNGVKLNRGSNLGDFSIFGDGDTPVNSIVINGGISNSGTSQVDVIVSKDEEEKTFDLVFLKSSNEEDRIKIDAWENVDAIQVFKNGQFLNHGVYYCDITDNINLNTLFVASKLKYVQNNIPVVTNTSDVIFLLAQKPFSQIDRLVNAVYPIANMNFDDSYFKFVAVNTKPSLLANQSQIKYSFPHIRVLKFNKEKTLKDAINGIDGILKIDGTQTVGPDV